VAAFLTGQPFRLAALVAIAIACWSAVRRRRRPAGHGARCAHVAVLPTDTSHIVVGVDGIGGGYNPHELSDQSAVTTALSTLLLPSVFRTAPDGTSTLDTTLMVSAEVTNASPFTVVYQVRTDATWSDGTPIDAADFVYLRSQMVGQPGVIDPAGYRLISGIAARNNLKTISVPLRRPIRPGARCSPTCCPRTCSRTRPAASPAR